MTAQISRTISNRENSRAGSERDDPASQGEKEKGHDPDQQDNRTAGDEQGFHGCRLRDYEEQKDGGNFAGDCVESHFGLLRMVQAGVGQHIQNKARRRGEQCKGKQPIDLPAKMKAYGGDAGASHQHQPAYREVAGQRGKLPPKLGQIDLEAGKEKQRGDTEGRRVGDDAVVNQGFEKASDNDSESKAGERGGRRKRCNARGTTSRPKTTVR